ncbi:Maf family protein [Alysiella crassa]|uniref:dTTP/UTP pyrophosphatase n=1 Tax=Alysiella crassa TaxID=153491 RepID=A0A376BLX0_9NEIS|nr:nucleoside triphosphate pyrophosphatase [Alysiella crassa]UOP07570.1 Maf family nucleotide pyrophosphatase [Alysiella crassa]SSY70214.1 Maf-like protein yhdE [Alysiella crassa]
MQPILLASGSPRRREILENLGFIVHKISAEIDETPHDGELAYDYVQRMAVEKNRAAIAQFGSTEQAILSADTTVALNGHILGKPDNAAHAHEILSALSGSTHQVMTAVCVSRGGREWVAVQCSDVQFKPLSEQEIAAYITSGEPMDKAGAYGIQGVGGVFVAHLSGSFTGVMGLPVFETLNLLREAGVDVPPFQAA